jgi:hypothetical protein
MELPQPIPNAIRSEVMKLAVGGSEAIPSEDLIHFASASGWIDSMSRTNAAYSYSRNPPWNESQRRILRHIQLDILRGYLLADLVRSFSEE